MEPWNFETKGTQLKEMAFLPSKLIGSLPMKIGWFWINLNGALYTVMGLVLIKLGLLMYDSVCLINWFKGLCLTAGRRLSNLGTMLATTLGVWCGKIGPRVSAQTQEGLCWTEAGIMRSACLYGSSLGLRWAQVVPMLGQVGPMLSHRAHVAPSWVPSWANVGPRWVHVGAIFGLCWPYVGLRQAYVGPRWTILAPMLGPCSGHRS